MPLALPSRSRRWVRWLTVLFALTTTLAVVLPQAAAQWVGEGHRMPSVPPQSAIDPAEPRSGCRYFPETRHNLCPPFLQYWDRFGGLLMFGYPLTEAYFAPELGDATHNGVTTQWFERARLEHHPGDIPERLDVLQGHIAREILAMLTSGVRPPDGAGSGWVGAGHRMPSVPPQSAIDPSEPRSGCRYFPETRHNLCPPFLQYWENYGGLLMFGYPLTEQYFAAELGDATHNGVTTQWFERVRLEHHPGDIPERLDVLQGHIAREILAMLTAGGGSRPTPTPTPGLARREVSAEVDGPSVRVLGEAVPPLAADEFVVRGTLRNEAGAGVSGSVYLCQVAISTGDQVDGLTGDPRCTGAINADGSGQFRSNPLRFRDLVGSDGGAVGLRPCAETDGRPGRSADDSCAATTLWVTFVRLVDFTVDPTMLTNGGGANEPFYFLFSPEPCTSVPWASYNTDCPGATREADVRTTLQLYVTLPAGAPAVQLRLLQQIDDPPNPTAGSVWGPSVSWEPCFEPPGASSQPWPDASTTDLVAHTVTISSDMVSSLEQSAWICGPGGGFVWVSFRLFWDVNGNGRLDNGIDQQIGETRSVAVW